MTGQAYDSNLDSMLQRGFILNPFASSLLCDSSCKRATQMPDDEVEKMSITTTSGGDEPSGLENTMIEDISSTPLEELQDSFGIYKEILPKTDNSKLEVELPIPRFFAFSQRHLA